MVRTFMVAAACAAVVIVSPTAFAQGKFGTAETLPQSCGLADAASIGGHAFPRGTFMPRLRMRASHADSLALGSMPRFIF
jgi:hypothetical protein